VLAYEPQPAMYRYLRAGLSPRWYRNVTLSDLALSDRAGTASLHVPVVSGEQQIAWASLQAGAGDGGADVTVFTSRLDDEVGDRPVSFVKCDVEGHELKVLTGASRLLHEQRPVWLVEIEYRHAGTAVGQVLSILSEAGYEPSFLTSGGELVPVPTDHRTPQRLNDVEPGRYVNNFLFIPSGPAQAQP
nr:FkbM family methyltransferase [Nocardioidaceae bacterium]